MEKKSVLFICTHNSVRSQMAEGLLRARCEDRYVAYSAGAVRTGANPEAIRVMRELGIDISRQQSEEISVYHDDSFDYVVTLCDHARQAIPALPAHRQHLHRHFYDPGTHPGSMEERLAAFRRVRDELDRWIRTTLDDAAGDGNADLSAASPPE